MSVNSNRIIFNPSKDSELTIPIQINWDFLGQEQSIELYEEDVTKQVIGDGYDFEVQRFPHDVDPETGKSEINYEFYFYSGGSLSSITSWNMSYISEGFTTRNVYYFENSFSKSFFKLDFYDSVDDKRQTNYLSIIIPTQQGYMTTVLFNLSNVQIKIPKFKLDFVGDKEGFFIYWLRKLEFLNINTFYMTAKFYNAKTGQFTKMMNTPQGALPVSETFSFDSMKYFYYRVVVDYINQCYRVFSFDPVTNVSFRVGTNTPIKWYEYVNPQ